MRTNIIGGGASETPLVMESSEEGVWAETADVVVVGFGGAGVVACIEAREAGASVLAIDRFAGGGSTAVSGGVIYAGGTKYQREAGFDDNAGEMYKYLYAEGNAVTAETLRRFCDGSNSDMEWLDGLGVPHGSTLFSEKTTYPPAGHWLFYSGNEKTYGDQARPAPRGHCTADNGFGGHVHFRKLKDAALRLGVQLMLHAPVTRLVVDESGSVLGVEVNQLPNELWEEHDRLYSVINPWRPFNNGRAEKAILAARALEGRKPQRRLIRAKRGVILATGGFIYNLSMVTSSQPALSKHIMGLLRLGTMGDDGSGIKLGQSVGGEPSLMSHISLARTVSPPEAFVHGILVNQNGERFVNEAAYSILVGAEILKQPADGKAWLIMDAKHFWRGLRVSLFPGKGMFLAWGAPVLLNVLLGRARRARSLSAMAHKLGISAQGLAATVGEVNEHSTTGRPDRFGKLAEHVAPLTKGPFYAVNMSMGNRFAPAVAMTTGGLDIDEVSGGVKRADGSLIPHLFAAGRCAVGLVSNGFVSGLSIADTVFGGRRAGRAAANEGTVGETRRQSDPA